MPTSSTWPLTALATLSTLALGAQPRDYSLYGIRTDQIAPVYRTAEDLARLSEDELFDLSRKHGFFMRHPQDHPEITQVSDNLRGSDINETSVQGTTVFTYSISLISDPKAADTASRFSQAAGKEVLSGDAPNAGGCYVTADWRSKRYVVILRPSPVPPPASK